MRINNLAILAALSAAAGTAQTTLGTWSKAASLPVIQSEWDGVTIGDSLFVMGGEMKRTPRTDPSKASDELWIYDARTDTWKQGANMPGSRNHHAVAVVDGMIYVLGGYDFSCCGNYPWPYGTTNNWRYDPRTDAWKVLAPMPRRMGGGMAAGFEGKLYAFAGTDSGAFHSVGEVHEYDPETDAWRARAPMRNPREHVKGAVVDSLIYVIGGHQKPGSQKIDQPSVEAYSPRGDRWYDKGRMPAPRGGIGAAYLGGYIYVFGGEGADFSLFNRVDRFDPATGVWAQVNTTPSGGGIHGLATMVMKGKVHLVGGASPAGFNPRDYHDVFTPPVVEGCTDPAASNFDRYATRDDGSCSTVSAKVPALPPALRARVEGGFLRIDGLGGGSCRATLADLDGRVILEADLAGDAAVPVGKAAGLRLVRLRGPWGTVTRPLAVLQ
jgi:N-acetylneuraminic acid mutarotase